MIGGALVRRLDMQGYTNILSPDLDFTKQTVVEKFFAEEQPEYIFVAAGKSGGIGANQAFPADLMINNLQVSSNIIQSAHHYNAKKLLYLASSCVYPKFSNQPMHPNALMTDSLEPTNQAYATAKIAGITLTHAYKTQYRKAFISVIPSNNFGIGDDFDLNNAHVIGALIHRMHHAKIYNEPTVTIWGTGTARREFIYVDDLADGCIFVMQHYEGATPLNIGSGLELSISELAQTIQKVIGYEGELIYDTSKPDGMPLKMLDTSMLREMGWQAQTDIETALRVTYNWYLDANKNKG